MKKLIALCLMTAMVVMTVGPALSVAQITTDLTQDASGGTAPRVLVSWVARGDSYANAINFYRDDSTAEYSQILPSGVYQEHTTIAMCAIVESDYGIDYIDNVYADVFYPDFELGDHHTPLTNQSGEGCGQFMQQDLLTKLDKQKGIDLFCANVQDLNNNLPTWQQDSYSTLCGDNGKLYQDEAVVYCGTKTISYEDPAGDYKITTLVQDNNGQSGVHDHGFTYIGVNAFEVDFTGVAYGPVKLGVNKIIGGDFTFNPPTDNKASIRNVGNVRLAINVTQDDMNLGKTSGLWNVSYGARIGHMVDFATYDPEETKDILDELDLSELNKMDFSVLVTKFPFPMPMGGFVGTMTLGSSVAAFDVCTQ